LLSALSSLASLAAISIYNAQLYERVQQRAQQMSTLWSVGRAISAHLDVDQIADTLSDQIQKLLGADLCVLALYEKGRLVPQGRASEKAPDRVQAAGLAECECDLITREAARRGSPLSQPNIESMAPGRCRWLRAGRLPGTHSVLAVPLVFDAETLGVMTVYRSGPEPFTQEESDLITTLGSLSVAAIRNARSFEREHNIAETLQTFFLTAPPANVPGFEIAEKYFPTSQEAKIGGDYYDFIPLPSSRLAILIGDISGKGLAAAVYTAMAKYTLRAFSSTPNIQPSQVVDFTNLAMTRHTSGEIFSTLFYGILDFATNTLTYVNAGHEPPLLIRQGRAESLEPTGTLVGAFPDAAYEQEVLHLHSGDVLALYTDGLTDARSPIGTFFTNYGAASVLKKQPLSASASEMAGALYAEAKDFSAGVIEDDIALLVVKVM
ncbi:MAG TPA: GAF domain-containing SpoIIE family protein phosphatase, partial [Capsulimonadaceae bacterium]|nr:GAF domain-containing SpoIIE family protein phosphatase [Capsulimonadaceae bacterium]